MARDRVTKLTDAHPTMTSLTYALYETVPNLFAARKLCLPHLVCVCMLHLTTDACIWAGGVPVASLLVDLIHMPFGMPGGEGRKGGGTLCELTHPICLVPLLTSHPPSDRQPLLGGNTCVLRSRC